MPLAPSSTKPAPRKRRLQHGLVGADDPQHARLRGVCSGFSVSGLGFSAHQSIWEDVKKQSWAQRFGSCIVM